MGGIILTDLFVIRKQRLSTPDLYATSPTSPYSYPRTLGVNPRTFIAFACGFGLDNPIPTSIIGWVFGFGVSALVYWACWKVCPGYLGEMELDRTRLKAVYLDDADCVMVKNGDDVTSSERSERDAKEKENGAVDVYEVGERRSF